MTTETKRRLQQSLDETNDLNTAEGMFTLDLALMPLGIDIHVVYNPDAEMAHITYAQTEKSLNAETEHPMTLEDWGDLLTRLDAGEALTIS